MLQNPCKTLGFKKNMVYKIPPGGGGKPYPASGLIYNNHNFFRRMQRNLVNLIGQTGYKMNNMKEKWVQILQNDLCT